jgi:hypothetical protein
MDQSARSAEKKPLSTTGMVADNPAFGADEIRQVQMLMVLLSCLPSDGKVREVLKLALALPHEPCLSRISPPEDTSSRGLKIWLESLWIREGLTSDEQKLVAWQRSGENMIAAVQELKDVEEKIDLKLGIQRRG